MKFAKGKSGNPGGRPKEKQFLEALRMELTTLGEDHKALRAIARRVIERASKGDMTAISFLADRLDGKPAQAITNGDDGPFEVSVRRIERVIVEAGDLPGTLARNKDGLTADDWTIMADITSMVRDAVPDAAERPASEIYGVIRLALREHFGGR